MSDGAKHEIKYTTEINPTIWQTDNKATFKNAVSYEPNGVGKGKFERTKSAECIFAGTDKGIMTAVGTYDTSNHTFTWTIGINQHGTAIPNGVIDISIPNGHSYSDITLPTNWTMEPTTPDTTTKIIKVTADPPGSLNGDIILKTTADDEKLWAVNLPKDLEKDYSITTKFTSTSQTSINLTLTPKATLTSQVIEKTSDANTGYDYNEKEITWKIEYNQNKMAMTDIKITDKLQAGLSYVDGSAMLGDAPMTSDVTYRDNTITFEPADTTQGSAAQTITFQTKVSDDLLKWEGDKPSKEIKNSAAITFGEAPTDVISESKLSAASARYVGTRPLVKTGASNGGYRNYGWTININTNQIPMIKPELADVLEANLILDLESVKLHEATVNSTNGTLTQGDLVYDGSTALPTNANYQAKLEVQKFTFRFLGDTTKAYILTFDTDNMNSDAATYHNQVYFANDKDSSTGSSGDIKQAAASGGSTNPNRGSIKLTAKENGVSGSPIEGVTYTITGGKSGFTFTVTTNSKGVAWFTPLKFESYTITEKLPVTDEYLPLQFPPTLEIKAGAQTKNVEQLLYYSKATADNTVWIDYEPGANSTTGVNPPQKKYIKDTIVTISENPFTRSGYLFDGWNTAKDAGAATQYAPGETITLSANTTLYAQWHKVTSGDSGGGNGGGYIPPPQQGTWPPPVPEYIERPVLPPDPQGWESKNFHNTSALAQAMEKPLTGDMGGLVLSAVTENGVILSGVVFEVIFEGKSFTATSDKNGIVVFPNITPGNYTVRVLTIPPNMTFDKTKEFKIKVSKGNWSAAEAEIGFLTYTPKTGDRFPLALLLFATTAAFLLFCASGYAFFKEKQGKLAPAERETQNHDEEIPS